MQDFIVGQCVGEDDIALCGVEFYIIKESNEEIIYTGKTDEEGNIRVPFEYKRGEHRCEFILN